MKDHYQVIVIGAGTAGYVAAIRCAQLGLKTVCIDKWINKDGKPALGGTCLNVGCIPSKALLESTHHLEVVNKDISVHGIEVAKVGFKASSMIARKDKIVQELTGGIAQLFKANKVEWLQGQARLEANKKVFFTPHEGTQQALTADNIIIATGSIPAPLPFIPFDGKYITDSQDALDWDIAPKRLAVIGAGAIGLEMGSAWSRVGSKTTIIKMRPGLLPDADPDTGKAALRSFKAQGMEFRMGLKIDSVEIRNRGVDIEYTLNNGEKHSERFDKVLVAVGRKPYTGDLLGDDTGIKINDRGFVEVDENCKTSVEGIYAIGDVVRGPMLAHKGSEEGIVVAERIAGQKPHIDYNCIPMVIYTNPEIAWVGENEKQAQERGIETKTGKFQFLASGRAKAANDTAGFVKIISDAKTDRILGAHIVNYNASELIGQIVIAMECRSSTEDLQRTIFAHPSLSEAIHEAALDVDGRAIHTISKKRPTA